ncbi:MAG TPA: radical SAM family heme chaperone HemW [Acidobacteriota bacterium]
MKKAGLYIHFPFCRRACFYCHFFKIKHLPDRVEKYLAHVRREMRLRRDPGLAPDSVYLGGGSPSLLEAAQLAGILEAAAKYFRPAAGAEITLEANPDDLTPSRLRGWRDAGVNRLSIGVQSFQEGDLRFLKRTHGAIQAIRAVEMAREAGFANVGIDLMIGLPTQTQPSMKENFRVVGTLRPAHVSVYILENVPSSAAGDPSPDRDARLYDQARRALLDLGFEHYEVSNFCRPGKASRHNLKYWRMEPYVGLGPSAAGYLYGREYRNVSGLNKYGAAVRGGSLPQVKTRQWDPAKRRIITGLRLLAGIPAQAFASFPLETGFLLGEGFLCRRGRNIAVPPEKILLLNEILGYFI